MEIIKKGMVVENEKGETSIAGWVFVADEGGAINIDEMIEAAKEELER